MTEPSETPRTPEAFANVARSMICETDQFYMRSYESFEALFRAAMEQAWDECTDTAGNQMGLTGSAARVLALRNPYHALPSPTQQPDGTEAS
jgi:hypothetical protein